MSNKRTTQVDKTAEKKPGMVATLYAASTAKRPSTQIEYKGHEFFKTSKPNITNSIASNLQIPRHARASSAYQNGFQESNSSGVHFFEKGKSGNKVYDAQTNPYENWISNLQDSSNVRTKAREISRNSLFYQGSKKKDVSQLSNNSDLSIDSLKNLPIMQGERRSSSIQKQRLSNGKGFSKSGLRNSRNLSPSQSTSRQKYGDYFKSLEQNNSGTGSGISNRFEEFMEKLKIDKERFYNQLDPKSQRSAPQDNQFTISSATFKTNVLNLSIEDLVNRSLNIRNTNQAPELIASTERNIEQPKGQMNPFGSEIRLRGQGLDIVFQGNEASSRAETGINQREIDTSATNNSQKVDMITHTSTMKPEFTRSTEISKESSANTAEIEIELLKLRKETLLNDGKLKERDDQIADLKAKLKEIFEKAQKDQVNQNESSKYKLEIEKLSIEKKQLEKDLEVSKALSFKLQKSLDEYEVQILRFKTQLETGTRSTVEKEEGLKKQMEALSQENKLLKENIESLKKNLVELQGAASGSKQSNDAAELKLNKSLEREEELKKQIELMKQTIDGKMKEIDLLKQVPKDSGAAQQEVQKLKSEYSNLSQENEGNKIIIKNLNEQISNLSLKANEAQEKTSQLEIQRTEQISVLSTKLDEAQAHIRMLESQASDSVSSLNAKLIEAQEKAKQTELQANNQLAAMSAKLNEAQAKIQLLESKPNDQLAAMQANIEEYKAKIKSLEASNNAQSSAMTAKFEEAQAKIQELESQLRQTQLEAQKANLEAQKAQQEAQKAKTFQFENPSGNASDEANLRFENQRLEREMSIIIEKFDKMQKELAEAQDMIEKSLSFKEMQQENEAQQTQIIELSNRVMMLQLEKQEAEKKYNDILNDKSKVSDKEKAARTEADKFKNENKKFNDMLRDMEKKLTNDKKDYEKKLVQEQKNNADLKNQIAKITAKDKVAAAAEESRQLAEKLSIEINALREQQPKMMEDFKQQIASLKEENAKIKNELDMKSKKLASFGGNEEATRALVARTKEVLALKEEVQKLKSQGGGGGQSPVQTDNAELMEELERFKKVAEDKGSLLKKALTENKALNEKLSNKETEAEELTEQLQKLQTELSKYVKK